MGFWPVAGPLDTPARSELMTTSRPPLISRVQGAFFGLFTWLVRVLPMRAGLALMSGLGTLGHLLLRQRRRAAEGRIAQALGLPPGSKACRRISRGSCRSIARGIFESWWLDGLEARRPGTVAINVTGLEHVARAREDGRGVLLVASHFSSFLLPGRALVPHVGKVHALSRPRGNASIQARYERGPLRFLSGNVGMQGAASQVMRWLRDGEIVVVLVDQRASRRHGVRLQFLGMTARHHNLAGQLAARTGAALIPLYCRHIEGQPRYEVDLEAPLEVDAGLARDEAARDLTQRLSDSLSARVRAHPGHYMWFHDRWRGEVPEGDETPARSVATVGQGTTGR